MSSNFIPLAAPAFAGNEIKYVNDCLTSTWISSTGKYIREFETAFARFCNVPHAISCCNGTAALHLALLGLGIGAGDEVIAPTLTFVATANAVTYCHATPVFIDCEEATWNLDPDLIESKITPRTRAIIVVHLYGLPASMDRILAIAQKHNLYVIEDAAQAHGAEYKGQKVGSFGDVATFSFYGNKIITCGEGGMVITRNELLASRIRILKGQGMDPNRRYWFPLIGYNYRMTNIAAAIGLAQTERVEWHIEQRIKVAGWYRKILSESRIVSWQQQSPVSKSADWLFTVLLRNSIAIERDEVARYLFEREIETRPVFYPMHILPSYKNLTGNDSFPVAERVARQGLSLPTWAGLKYETVRYICSTLENSVRK